MNTRTHRRVVRNRKKSATPLSTLRTLDAVKTVVAHPRRLEELLKMLGIRSAPTPFVNAPSVGHVEIAPLVDLHLSVGHGGGGHVEHEGRPVRLGDGEADGVSA